MAAGFLSPAGEPTRCFKKGCCKTVDIVHHQQQGLSASAFVTLRRDKPRADVKAREVKDEKAIPSWDARKT